jgi:drug/metabolite transporter (DMT)-like permease
VALLFASAAYAFLPRRGSLTALMELHPVLLVLGVGVTATFGQLCLTRAFATGAPAKVSVVCLTQIVFALLLDMLWLGRPIPPVQTLVGVVLVITPTAWLMTRRKKGRRPPHPAPSTLTELHAEPVPSGR